MLITNIIYGRKSTVFGINHFGHTPKILPSLSLKKHSILAQYVIFVCESIRTVFKYKRKMAVVFKDIHVFVYLKLRKEMSTYFVYQWKPTLTEYVSFNQWI